MILRAGSMVLLAYVIGFILFTVTLGRPAADDAPATDAIIVLTGGPNRIEYAFAALKKRDGKRLLVSGTDPAVTKKDLVRRLGGNAALINCCVDLGSESYDTRSNAEEAARWLAKHRYRSFRLVTSDWHMRRARYDFGGLGDKYRLIPDAVRSEPNFMTLFGEYNKYVVRRIAALVDI